MNARLIETIHCGYTNCDIHDDHHATITVEMYTRNRYNLIVQSACFGRTEHQALTRTELGIELNRWAFLPHTRRSIRKYGRLRRQIAAGYFEQENIFANRLRVTPSLITPPPPPPPPPPQPMVEYVGGSGWTGASTAVSWSNLSAHLVEESRRGYAEQREIWARWTDLTAQAERQAAMFSNLVAVQDLGSLLRGA